MIGISVVERLIIETWLLQYIKKLIVPANVSAVLNEQ